MLARKKGPKEPRMRKGPGEELKCALKTNKTNSFQKNSPKEGA